MADEKELESLREKVDALKIQGFSRGSSESSGDQGERSPGVSQRGVVGGQGTSGEEAESATGPVGRGI